MAADSQNYQQPYAEDYFSDDGGQGISLESPPPPGTPQANVRYKRSNPDNKGSDKTPTQGRAPNNADVKSDSGYSSHSVAGMSSADSTASATSSHRSPPVVPVTTVPAAPSPTPAQRAPRPAHQRRESTQSSQSASSRQQLPRRDSQASRRPPVERRPTISQAPPKRRDSRNVEECTVPGCTNCGPDAIGPSRPRPSRRSSMLHQPAESAPNVSYPPHHYDTRSQVSDPAQYHPSSPITSRQPRTYHTPGAPVIQPAVSRRLSVNSRQPRPTSYHGDPRDGYPWPQPSMQPTQPSPPDHGPPLSRSAYGNMPYPQHPMTPGFPPQPYGPPNPYFSQAQQMQPMTQSFEQPRPHLNARGSSLSSYGHNMGPIVTQVAERRDRPNLSARYSSQGPPQVQARPPPRQIEYNDDDSESESESESEEEEVHERERRRHPVRRITDAPEVHVPNRRPHMPHANTTPVLDRVHHNPQTVVVQRPSRRDQERERGSRSDRRTSVSRPRPPLVPPVKANSYSTSRADRVIIENPQSSRRRSQQITDMTFEGREKASRRAYNVEPKRQNRSSRVYETGRDYEREYSDNEDDEEEPQPVARAPLRRRDTDADSRRRPQRPVEVRRKVDAAESYINAGRGDSDTYADQAFEKAKKKSSRISGGPSEAESSRSRGSDKANGEIRLRIGNDAPVTLSLNGDMEGRTLQLVPIDNGMNELVISGNGRGESIYHSERGSVRSERKAIMSSNQTRRDAEEIMTERSSHSSRRRRDPRGEDEPRRVLGRRRESEYRY